jgi:glycosyltransferase involved in cell wall biosynthesis
MAGCDKHFHVLCLRTKRKGGLLLLLLCVATRLLLYAPPLRFFRAARGAWRGAPVRAATAASAAAPAPFTAAALENGRLLVNWAATSCARYYDGGGIARRAGGAVRGALSVVVGAYSRPLTLTLIVESLRRQRLVEDLEVLVMDGGSDPPLQALLPDLPVDVWRAWPLDGGYHRVRSYNEGVRLARHPIIALLDDDVVPLSEYWAHSILRTLETHQQRVPPRHNNVTLGKLEIMEFEEDLSDVPRRFRDVDTLHWMGKQDKKTGGFAIGDGFYEKSTVNIAFTRHAWETAGGFSPTLDGVYGEEDVEFFKRVFNHPWYTIKNGDFSACALHVGKFYGNQQRCSPVRDSRGRYKMRGNNCSGVPLPEHLQKANLANGLQPDESWW